MNRVLRLQNAKNPTPRSRFTFREIPQLHLYHKHSAVPVKIVVRYQLFLLRLECRIIGARRDKNRENGNPKERQSVTLFSLVVESMFRLSATRPSCTKVPSTRRVQLRQKDSSNDEFGLSIGPTGWITNSQYITGFSDGSSLQSSSNT